MIIEFILLNLLWVLLYLTSQFIVEKLGKEIREYGNVPKWWRNFIVFMSALLWVLSVVVCSVTVILMVLKTLLGL